MEIIFLIIVLSLPIFIIYYKNKLKKERINLSINLIKEYIRLELINNKDKNYLMFCNVVKKAITNSIILNGLTYIRVPNVTIIFGGIHKNTKNDFCIRCDIKQASNEEERLMIKILNYTSTIINTNTIYKSKIILFNEK